MAILLDTDKANDAIDVQKWVRIELYQTSTGEWKLSAVAGNTEGFADKHYWPNHYTYSKESALQEAIDFIKFGMG